jgi:hypothetical protein
VHSPHPPHLLFDVDEAAPAAARDRIGAGRWWCATYIRPYKNALALCTDFDAVIHATAMVHWIWFEYN